MSDRLLVSTRKGLFQVARTAIASGRFDVMMLAYHHGIWGNLDAIVHEAAEKNIGIEAHRIANDIGVKEITVHDLRRTGRTKLTSDEVGVDEFTAERVLNHVVGSRQQRAYDWQSYLTQKRAALEAWEREILRLISKKRRGPAPTRKSNPVGNEAHVTP